MLHSLKVNTLSNKIPWFGNHTGYEQMPLFLQKFQPDIQISSPKPGMLERFIGKAYSSYRRWPPRNQNDAAAELRFFMAAQKQQCINHILYLEDHLLFLDHWSKAPINFVGTIHLPPLQWNFSKLENLKRLSSAVILYQRDLEFFETYVGKNRVKFIHYGVDTDFFFPTNSQLTTKRILFAGHYLRNTLMLHRIVLRLVEKYPDLSFDLLVPEHARKVDGLLQLSNHPAVTWHQKLSDESLRTLYRSSYLLLLPMNENGASTAVVEAMACGLPIVTTNMGGIQDYGGNSIFPIVSNNDDDATIDLIEQYLNQSDWRDEVARRCREFAQKNLAWPLIAQKHLETYESLTT